MFFRLLLESFRRQRRRKLLAGAAIFLGITAVTAMLALATTIGDRIHRELAVYGANIVMTPQAAALSVSIGGVDLHPATGNAFLHESDLAKLRTIFWANNITGISPELPISLTVTPDPGATPRASPHAATHLLARGLWFDHDLAGLRTGAPSLHPSWRLQGHWPRRLDQVVLGNTIAATQNLHIGDVIRLQAPGASGLRLPPESYPYTVAGIVSTGDSTDRELLLPLAAAQALNNTPDAISRVEVSARTRPEDAFARRDPDTLPPKQRDLWYCRPYANSIAYQIHEAIPSARAEQLRQVEQSEGNILARISGLMWLIAAAALLAAAFAVSAAMATAILERRAEIGLMRSLGASRAAIATLFYVETGALALAAGTLGYLAGSGLAAWLGARIFNSAATPAAHLAPFNLVLLPVVLALALLLSAAGSTPAIRGALRLDPSTILRADA